MDIFPVPILIRFHSRPLTHPPSSLPIFPHSHLSPVLPPRTDLHPPLLQLKLQEHDVHAVRSAALAWKQAAAQFTGSLLTFVCWKQASSKPSLHIDGSNLYEVNILSMNPIIPLYTMFSSMYLRHAHISKKINRGRCIAHPYPPVRVRVNVFSN